FPPVSGNSSNRSSRWACHFLRGNEAEFPSDQWFPLRCSLKLQRGGEQEAVHGDVQTFLFIAKSLMEIKPQRLVSGREAEPLEEIVCSYSGRGPIEIGLIIGDAESADICSKINMKFLKQILAPAEPEDGVIQFISRVAAEGANCSVKGKLGIHPPVTKPRDRVQSERTRFAHLHNSHQRAGICDEQL